MKVIWHIDWFEYKLLQQSISWSINYEFGLSCYSLGMDYISLKWTPPIFYIPSLSTLLALQILH
jgi:hypothetical protein